MAGIAMKRRSSSSAFQKKCLQTPSSRNIASRSSNEPPTHADSVTILNSQSGEPLMCGIVGYIGPKKVVPVVIEGLRKLEYRGYDSAGIAVVNDGKLEVRRAPGKLRNLEEALQKSPIEGTYGIGHTRWATHGRPTA